MRFGLFCRFDGLDGLSWERGGRSPWQHDEVLCKEMYLAQKCNLSMASLSKFVWREEKSLSPTKQTVA